MDTNTMLVKESLKSAGFGTALSQGFVRVFLNRPISTMEVTVALRNDGFSGHQFRTFRINDAVMVEAS